MTLFPVLLMFTPYSVIPWLVGLFIKLFFNAVGKTVPTVKMPELMLVKTTALRYHRRQAFVSGIRAIVRLQKRPCTIIIPINNIAQGSFDTSHSGWGG